MADASRRVGTLALVLLGPLLVLGKCALDPNGDAFPAVDRSARGINLVLLSMEGVSAEDVRLFDPQTTDPDDEDPRPLRSVPMVLDADQS